MVGRVGGGDVNESLSPKRRLGLGPILLVSMVALAVLGGDRYFVLRARLVRLERVVAHTHLALARLEARSLRRTTLARVQGIWSVRFATLTAQEDRLAKEVAKLKSLGPTRRTAAAALAEASELVALARVDGRLTGRPRSSAPLLEAAAKLLAAVPEPSLATLVEKLRTAAALRQRLPSFPYGRARAVLASLPRDLTTWPLSGGSPSSSVSPQIAQPPTPTVHGFWAKIWSAILRFVHSTVRIEHLPPHARRRLSPRHLRRLRRRLELEIATARLAVDARDPHLVRRLGRSILRHLAQLYDVHDPAVGRTMAALSAVVHAPRPVPPPSLEPVRRRLGALLHALLES